MTSGGPCCAHSRISIRREDYPLSEESAAAIRATWIPDDVHVPPRAGQTMTRSWWACDDCETKFAPDYLVSKNIEKSPAASRPSEPVPTIRYWCRACPQVFYDADTSNAHHDATGHHQTHRPEVAFGAASRPSEERPAPPLEKPLRMDAYYYGFTPTGVREIDLILSAVATAGKSFHHTDDWREPLDNPERFAPPFRGADVVEFIQNAADDAAKAIRQLRGEP